MSKVTRPKQAMVFCGIDVSAATLAVAVQQENQRFEERVFDNTASGHRTLIGWLRKNKVPVRAYRLRRPAFTHWTLRWRSIRPRASKSRCSIRS